MVNTDTGVEYWLVGSFLNEVDNKPNPTFVNRLDTIPVKKNKLISKRRFKVEQCFGTIKRKFNFSRASYLRTEKVEGQFYFKAMCFNLLKAVRKVKMA